MDIIFASTLLVALAEIGDKTMLLAIILAARFRAPWPIIAGIFAATIVNHALAAWAGSAISGLLDGFWFRLAVALGFLAMAAWILVPDKIDEDEVDKPARYGVFLTTSLAFFMAEMGDKTQIATVALGARYHAVELVAIGTTLGMMIANVPAVFLGDRITRIVPLRAMRIGAAIIFAILGALAIRELLG
ncbi:TMEM165/GDT1 family protein [Sphingomonadaceae bacterium G21617-S1]|jgi:putative Ca2+/H+ antiporter (TMEM165/GDT1 family)|uniref:TMEM165/GDT1 family protein n=1 Tax=Rhizorhabdus sp. TaxID=1968843 RepID=UPI0019CC90B2|nr:TMEM165/GDT1 family protein [Rhizorhabdus sp.]MBD3760709.1 TMEM165/GDT1 family protein [Rhizorhabdus sp.]MCZ4341710.1 TMEM165/GDT1 family protein [Sphingomonadaceae bacterium G21617-S1]